MNRKVRFYLTLAAFVVGVILSSTYAHVSASATIALLYHIIGGLGLPFLIWRACSAFGSNQEN